MAAPYEYRDGALWLRLDGLGTPAEMHAELLRALVQVLMTLQDGPSKYPDNVVYPLQNLLHTLLPSAAQLEAGRGAVKAEDGPTMQTILSTGKTE